MKTQLQFTALATLIVALSFGMSASTFDFDPEPYINDIPFNTEEIAAAYLYNQAITVPFELDDETYIDDIPFNTECIAANCIYHEALNVNFNLEEEAYIDDIPFKTEKIAMESRYEKAINEAFTFTDEPYVDDIPRILLQRKPQSLVIISNEINTLYVRAK